MVSDLAPQSDLAFRVKVLQSFGNALAHSLLTLAHPHTRIIVSEQRHDKYQLYKGCCCELYVLLIGLVLALGVANLSQDVIFLREDIVADAFEIGVLLICLEDAHIAVVLCRYLPAYQCPGSP